MTNNVNMYVVINLLTRYANGEIDQETANKKLEEMGINLTCEPMKNYLYNDNAQISADLTNVNGYVELDTGTGYHDTVRVVDNKLVNLDVGNMYTLALVGDFMFRVKGDMITEFVGMKEKE